MKMVCDHRKALDLVKAGSWDEAHQLVQDGSDRMSCLIHAYLHRVEGDLSNARYWYRRAGESFPDGSLDQEWMQLFKMLS